MRTRRFRLAAIAVLVSVAAFASIARAAEAGPGRSLVMRWNGTKWVKFGTPDVAGGEELLGVDAVGKANAWAVGLHGSGQNAHPLILHWNGSKWSSQALPATPGGSRLAAIDASSANLAWAVGSEGDGHPLALRWNGQKWTKSDVPRVGDEPTQLRGVVTVSSSEAWAVGSHDSGTATLHFDGAHWAAVATPTQGTANSSLAAVGAFGAGDVWSVGSVITGSGFVTLVQHFDGDSWKRSPVTLHNGDLDSVLPLSQHAIWAGGNHEGDVHQTLAMHWPAANPADFSVTSTKNPGGDSDNDVNGVAGKAGDIWIVGEYFNGTGVSTLTEHFNGSKWTVVHSPNGAQKLNLLDGVAAVPGSGRYWAVGFSTKNAIG